MVYTVTASVFPYIPITSCDAISLHNIPVLINVEVHEDIKTAKASKSLGLDGK